MTSEEIMLHKVPQKLCDADINFSLRSAGVGGGFVVKLGNEPGGYKAEGIVNSYLDALRWLDHHACAHYPDSKYVKPKTYKQQVVG